MIDINPSTTLTFQLADDSEKLWKATSLLVEALGGTVLDDYEEHTGEWVVETDLPSDAHMAAVALLEGVEDGQAERDRLLESLIPSDWEVVHDYELYSPFDGGRVRARCDWKHRVLYMPRPLTSRLLLSGLHEVGHAVLHNKQWVTKHTYHRFEFEANAFGVQRMAEAGMVFPASLGPSLVEDIGHWTEQSTEQCPKVVAWLASKDPLKGLLEAQLG